MIICYDSPRKLTGHLSIKQTSLPLSSMASEPSSSSSGLFCRAFHGCICWYTPLSSSLSTSEAWVCLGTCLLQGVLFLSYTTWKTPSHPSRPTVNIITTGKPSQAPPSSILLPLAEVVYFSLFPWRTGHASPLGTLSSCTQVICLMHPPLY